LIYVHFPYPWSSLLLPRRACSTCVLRLREPINF
jgi:hypothetical protein